MRNWIEIDTFRRFTIAQMMVWGYGTNTMLKNNPWMALKRPHIWVYYMIDVCRPIGSEIFLDYNDWGFGIEWDSNPYHDIATSMPIPFIDAGTVELGYNEDIQKSRFFLLYI